MFLTDGQPHNSDFLHLSVSTKTYWRRQLSSNGGNLFVHLIIRIKFRRFCSFFLEKVTVRNSGQSFGQIPIEKICSSDSYSSMFEFFMNFSRTLDVGIEFATFFFEQMKKVNIQVLDELWQTDMLKM